MDKLDRQAERTDELVRIMRTSHQRTPERRRSAAQGPSRSPPPTQQHGRRHVQGSLYKKRSPKSGNVQPRRTSRAPHRREGTSISLSSNSSVSDVEGEVSRALEMLEPRFTRQKGKRRSREDNLVQYHPFAFLEREQQRAVIKSGHPEELSVTHHLSGLCAMALETCSEQSETFGIVGHISQLLDDTSYMQWHSVRAFSNTVISQIARGRWSWCDDRLIERCRTNVYMRSRTGDDTSWSVPCPRFNKGRCNEQDTHAVGDVLMRHVCFFVP